MAKKYDLQERLVNFAVAVIRLAEKFPKTYSGIHLAGQVTRSGSAPALNYGEAQSAESRNDFIHKMKIALKEIRETNCCFRIVAKLKWVEENDIASVLSECDELAAIFATSIKTATTNKRSPG